MELSVVKHGRHSESDEFNSFNPRHQQTTSAQIFSKTEWYPVVAKIFEETCLY
jgi:hypothetical protein